MYRQPILLASLLTLCPLLSSPGRCLPAQETLIATGGEPKGPLASRMGGNFLLEGKGGRATAVAIRSGLAWLAQEQDEDGSWNPSPGKAKQRTGTTALALLAFLGEAYGTQEGPHHLAEKRALSWLLARQEESGHIGDPKAPMSGIDHCLATWALLEQQTLYPGESTGQALKRALGRLENTQTPSGGWSEHLDPEGEPNTNVTLWALYTIVLGHKLGNDQAFACVISASEWLKSAIPATEPLPRKAEKGEHYPTMPGSTLNEGWRYTQSLIEADIPKMPLFNKPDFEEHPKEKKVREQVRDLEGKLSKEKKKGGRIASIERKLKAKQTELDRLAKRNVTIKSYHMDTRFFHTHHARLWPDSWKRHGRPCQAPLLSAQYPADHKHAGAWPLKETDDWIPGPGVRWGGTVSTTAMAVMILQGEYRYPGR